MKKKYKAPMGTIAILSIYVILIILMWGSVYLVLLSRGGTS